MFRISALIPFLAACMACLVACGELGGYSTGKIKPHVAGVDTKSNPVITTGVLQDDGKFHMEAVLDEDGYRSDDTTVPAGVYFNATVSNSQQNKTEWALNEDQYWVNGVNIRFWCWNYDPSSVGLTPLQGDALSSSHSFNYSQIPENRSDIILAYAQKTWSDGQSDQVDILFHHPLSNICFTDASQVHSNLEVVRITLRNVKTSGSFTFDADRSTMFEWSALSGQSDVAEASSRETLATTNFFLPPQTLEDVVLRVDFRHKVNSNEYMFEKSLYSSTDQSMQEWRPDCYYKYRISLSHDFTNPISFTVSLESWGAESFVDIP